MYKIPIENLILEARESIYSERNNKGYVKIIPNGESTKPLTDRFIEEKVLFHIEGITQPPLKGSNKAYEIDLNYIKVTY